MPNPLLLAAGVSAGGGLLSANAQKKAANKASAAQQAAAEAGIAEQRRQFNLLRKLAQPYVDAGTKGLYGSMSLMGLNGAKEQRTAIDGIQNGVQFKSMVKSGEEAITANASATGGLRGGNTEAALAQFRPQILSSLIDKQLSNLSGLAANGQNAAAGVGSAAQATGNNISGLLEGQGAAQAGASLAAGQANANMWGGLASTAGNVLGSIPMPTGASTFGKWGF